MVKENEGKFCLLFHIVNLCLPFLSLKLRLLQSTLQHWGWDYANYISGASGQVLLPGGTGRALASDRRTEEVFFLFLLLASFPPAVALKQGSRLQLISAFLALVLLWPLQSTSNCATLPLRAVNQSPRSNHMISPSESQNQLSCVTLWGSEHLLCGDTYPRIPGFANTISSLSLSQPEE